MRCPICGALKGTADTGKVRFDIEAINLIKSSGGIYGGIFSIDGTNAVLVWCETSAFRFSESEGIEWKYDSVGLIDDVIMKEKYLEIDTCGKIITLMQKDGSDRRKTEQ